MAIKHVTGVPGTGKTYFAIHDVILRYYKWDDQHVEWQYDQQKTKKPVLIYTNIEQLKLPHVNIDDYCSHHNIDVYTFFTTGYWDQHIDYKNYQVVIILDEAQRYFPSSFRLKGAPRPEENPLYWFQYHRHFGADVYVITQTYDAVCRHVVQLAEYEIHAITKVYSVGNSFRYVYRTGLHPDDIVARKTIRYSRRVGMLYQSFMAESDDKDRPNPFRKYAFLVVLLSLILAFGFTRFVSSFRPSETQTQDPRGGEPTATESLRSAPFSKTLPVPKQDEKPVTETPVEQVAVLTGGFWQGVELKAIEFYGDLIPVRDFGFPYFPDYKNMRVLMYLPVDFLNDIQVAKNRRYYDSGQGWRDIDPPQEQGRRRFDWDPSDAQRAKMRAKDDIAQNKQSFRDRQNQGLPF